MLEDAGLENFPQLFAEAIVSGSLHLDSLYATKLSDSAMNINRPKAEGFRYSYVYKLVCALASSRPRCGAALVHVFRHPWASYPHAHTRAPRGSGISALDTVRGDVQDRSHLGDLLPSQTTLNNVFLVLAVDSEAGAFQGRNLQAFVEQLAVESQAAGEAAADEGTTESPCTHPAQAKARKVDVNQRYRFDESLGVRVRTKRERKYSAPQLALARRSRRSRHAAACLSLA
jgi:hypothetical protein